MLRGIVSAKSVFFDSNPSGRILNRFSSDTDTMDERFGQILSHFVHFCFILSGVLVIMLIANPYGLILLVVVVICMFLLIKHIISCCRESKRTELI